MKLKRQVNTECHVRMSLASLQGDAVLPWPLTTAVPVPAHDWKEAPGLIVLICSEPGSRQQWSRTLDVSTAERPWQLAVTMTLDCDLPVHSVHGEVASMGRSPLPNPPIHLKWLFILKWLMERGVMICLYCAIEWNRLLSIHLNHGGQSHLKWWTRGVLGSVYFRSLNLNLFTDRFATH